MGSADRPDSQNRVMGITERRAPVSRTWTTRPSPVRSRGVEAPGSATTTSRPAPGSTPKSSRSGTGVHFSGTPELGAGVALRACVRRTVTHPAHRRAVFPPMLADRSRARSPGSARRRVGFSRPHSLGGRNPTAPSARSHDSCQGRGWSGPADGPARATGAGARRRAGTSPGSVPQPLRSCRSRQARFDVSIWGSSLRTSGRSPRRSARSSPACCRSSSGGSRPSSSS
ncbi:hypothetical protein SAMN04489726_1987 [Allokutzneria albata]|uniref:Uncharacterized protein n=1 Tax=Allokutzneria albata TaxID=211114 RepID=A0A1G9TTD4_ALLAB|nr:hypothetical protein SAMN04489726_1987 [Allokutzneria albata]